MSTSLGAVATAVWWLGLVLIVPGGFFEAFVTPELGADLQAQVEDAAAPVLGLAGLCYLGGAVLVGIASWRSRALPRPAAAALVAAAAVLLLLPALPGADGWWIIAGSVTTGSVMVVAGLVCAPAAQAHAPATRRVPA
jgi:hypothetical protein